MPGFRTVIVKILCLALLVEIFAAFRISPSAALARLLVAPTFTRPIIALLLAVRVSLALLLSRLSNFLTGLALSRAVLSITLLVLPLSRFALILLIAILLICHCSHSLVKSGENCRGGELQSTCRDFQCRNAISA